jgi:ribosomal subunit interface protein
MQPVQIVIRDMPNSHALEDHIRKKAEKLNHYYDRIGSCRIVIDVPQKHKRHGRLFCVRIDLTVPGRELVVNRKLDEDVYVAIRDAFHALLRQLESYSCKRRGDVKTHESSNVGYIKRLFFDEGYGFIQGIDGNEFYFSPTNVTNPSFEQLCIGDVVQFLGVTADDGLQAHRITIEKKNHIQEELS